MTNLISYFPMFGLPHKLEDIDQDLFSKQDVHICPQCLAMYGMLRMDAWIGVWMDGYAKDAKDYLAIR